MRKPGLRVGLLAWAVGLLGAGCATVATHEGPLPPAGFDPRYDQLFPYYVELCALSQIRANFAPRGGSPGHAAMYVKGACRDPSTDFPTLKVCGPEADLADPESGSGVSVNKMLRNVNWIATPGKRLFYHGNLRPDEVLDVDRALATIDAAEEAGVFDGVAIHGSYQPPPGDEEALLYLVAAETLGTDFALSFGRTLFCSRLPLEHRQLTDVIEYLNDLNRNYARGGYDYNWSGYNDNCSHTLHNALAAAGVWRRKSIASYQLGQLLNLSVPANEFADLALLTTSFPIDDFERILADATLRRTLAQRSWLPVRHGATLKRIPVHQNNELYETDLAIFLLENPFRRAKSRRVDELFDDPRNTDLEANLVHFQELYRRILGEAPTDRGASFEDDADRRARAHYYAFIETQLQDVVDKLSLLRELEAAIDADR